MMRLTRCTLLGLAVLAAGALPDWGLFGGLVGQADARQPGPKGPKGKGKGKGPEKQRDDLQKTYDALTEVLVWARADRGRPPREVADLLDQAKDLYRDAVGAYRDDDGRRAGELALAAHDAARGLLHLMRANAPAASGLPAPPRRAADDLDEVLRRARDRIEDAGADAGRGPGRAFLDASRRAYDQARRASRDDPARAAELARAAEAWAHVGEHLSRADGREDVRRGPERRDRPPPPLPDE